MIVNETLQDCQSSKHVIDPEACSMAGITEIVMDGISH
jgi:hypothetical protein